ncbi:MAG: RidA family protein [Bryobacteraceae bacterium]|nr:RidA family protein [Solibacteraceae bacterium]MCO5351206.1 RidA family protein [Bryobacteraceae bacterium]
MPATSRRNLLAAAAAATAVPAAAQAQSPAATARRAHYRSGKRPAKPPLYSPMIIHNGLIYISGKGAHFEGDIQAHTKHVLDEIEKDLQSAGSSMDKVLKVTVYLAKAEFYGPMNEVYRGRFGDDPPVRTTTAAAWIPGNSLIEIDVIAAL